MSHSAYSYVYSDLTVALPFIVAAVNSEWGIPWDIPGNLIHLYTLHYE